jgi:hypothetical protein
MKTKTRGAIILLVLLYALEIWSFTLREEYRLRVFENNVLRKIFGPKRDEVTEKRKYYVTRNFMLCTPHQILFG